MKKKKLIKDYYDDNQVINKEVMLIEIRRKFLQLVKLKEIERYYELILVPYEPQPSIFENLFYSCNIL